MWKVYKRTCPNGKVYIGITSKTLEERMGNGYQNNREFALDIIKFGKESIISEILEEHKTYDAAVEREWHYINQYRNICYNKVGNSKDRLVSRTDPFAQSSLHSTTSTETSAQHLPHKQYIVPLTTKPTNRRTCPISTYDITGKYLCTYENAVVAAKETGVNKGDIISCCRGVKSNGQPRYQCKGIVFRYAVDKLNEYPEKPVACKKVHQYTLNGEYIRTFNSLKEAWLHTGATIGAIGHVCRGLAKSAGGYVWKYVE